jgi:hypothetical protein
VDFPGAEAPRTLAVDATTLSVNGTAILSGSTRRTFENEP